MGEREVICRTDIAWRHAAAWLARAPETDLVSMALLKDVQLGDLPFTSVGGLEWGEAHLGELG